jgi:signal transduction histidine kinase
VKIELKSNVLVVALIGATISTVFSPLPALDSTASAVVAGRAWFVNFAQITVACALALLWLRGEKDAQACSVRRMTWTALWSSLLASVIAAPIGLLAVHNPQWSGGVLAGQQLKCFGFAFGLCLIEAFVRVEVRRERAMGAARQAALASDRSELAARLAALQSQIEPHFIYNTLGNLRALVRTAPEQAEQLLAHLTSYLRAAMPSLRAPWRTVGQELDLASDYLAIMRVRLGDRLSVQIDADAATRALRVAPGLLATLVENAIKHGIDPLPEGGEVVIVAAQRNGVLLLEVRDTGAGLAPGEGSGVGLANLLERLALLYDDRATFDLTPNTPRGAVARVTIPLEALTAAHADRPAA